MSTKKNGSKSTPAATTAAAPRKSEPRYYKVRDRITGDVIYVLASNRSQAENFATYHRFEVTILSVKEVIKSKVDNIEIFDATDQPGPPAQVALGDQQQPAAGEPS